MKNLFYYLVLTSIFLLCSETHAQQWEKPLDMGGNYINSSINSVFFIDADTGWAAGSDGTIVFTTDGGATWAYQNSGTGQTLNSIYFINSNRGWVVGNSGTVRSTTDGGTTWTSQSLPGLTNDVFVRSVFFVDENYGWAVGRNETNNGRRYATTDGGATWTTQSGGGWPNHAVYFINQDTGWSVGNIINYTHNGGNDWIQCVGCATDLLYDVHFVNENRGWAVGINGTILRTTNGGVNWSTQNANTSEFFYSVFFIDENRGWIGAENGKIFRTTNGGSSWSSVSLGVPGSLNSVFFLDADNGFTASGGSIFYSDNSGVNWTEQSTGTSAWLYDVHFENQDVGWVVGGGNVWHTEDGGINWDKQDVGTISFLRSVHFVDENIGWVVGALGNVRKTTNGGSSWTGQNSGESSWLLSVYFPDPNNGWFVGWNGVIRSTTNGGSTWISQDSDTTEHLRSVFFTDSDNGWIVGENGVILATTNGGVDWTFQTSNTTNDLLSVYFINSSVGWIVGNGGTILTTSDGGSTWSAQNSNTSRNLWSVHFTDENNGWAVGDWSEIRITTDGGSSWVNQPSNSFNWLHAVYFTDPFNGWAVGRNGEILVYNHVCQDPDISSVTADPICVGSTATIQITGALNDADEWVIYTGSCGGIGANQVGSTDTNSFDVMPTSTTTYYIRGEGGCVIPNGCEEVEVIVNPLPPISCPSDFIVCVDGGLVDLSNLGSPTGGTFSGPNVLGSNFDPLSAGIGPHSINYEVTDGNNCSNDCDFEITVSHCLSVGGKINFVFNHSEGVNETDVKVNGSMNDMMLTATDGLFEFSLAQGGNYTITPSKETDLLNGVDVSDALLIQQHITFINRLTDPYLLIAADINKDAIISTLDALIIRQTILNNPAALVLFANSWTFVPENYVFPDSLKPWVHPESIDVNDLQMDESDLNFIGIKMGDLNGDADPENFIPSIPSRNQNANLLWKAVDAQWEEYDSEIEVTFKAGYFQEFAAYQFGLQFDPQVLEFVEVTTTGPLNLSENHFGAYQADQGELRGAWYSSSGEAHSLAEDTEVFTLRFRSLIREGSISEHLWLNDAIIPALVFDENLLRSGMEIEFVEDASVSVTDLEKGEFALFQNRPNPFREETVIGFVLPESGEATLRIVDISGKEVYRTTGQFPGGENELTIPVTDLASGIYFYELITDSGTLVKRMVVR